MTFKEAVIRKGKKTPLASLERNLLPSKSIFVVNPEKGNKKYLGAMEGKL